MADQVKQGTSPLTILEGGLSAAVATGTGNISGIQNTTKDVATNQNSLSNILPSFLFSKGFAMRAAEVLIGALLIAVGVAKLASDSPVAKAVGKIGLL